MEWLAEIHILLKPSVNDPQGLSIRGALHQLGFGQVADVRAGKVLQIRLTADDRVQAEAAVEAMCQKLLANPVIERYSFSVEHVTRDAPAPAP